jgi:hypothetical protein
MRNKSQDDTGLRDQEERFVQAFKETYAPRPLSPARRAALWQGVQERLERRGVLRFALPAMGTAFAGVLVASLFFAPSEPPTPQPRRSYAWEEELFFSAEPSERGVDSESAFLPDDYEAITAYFLDV